MTKNLEKLAEIGERKLLDDLSRGLIGIKQILMNIQRKGNLDSSQKEYLNKKIEIYCNLISTCKNYGLDIAEQESNFTQIIGNAQIISDKERYTGEEERISLEIIYSNTL